jgi:hypothetical protein
MPGNITDGIYDSKLKLESARVYGDIAAYGYYFIDLLVGTPPQRVSVIADTGSGLVAFPCAGCGHCGKHIDPTFDASNSSSLRWVPCGDACADGCSNGHCSYHQSYTEGSSFSGFWFEDWVRLGDRDSRNPSLWGRLGCHQKEDKLFYTQKANGIVGLGPFAKKGQSTLTQQLFADSGHVKSSVFAMCLSGLGGRLTFGGYNTSQHTQRIVWVPLLLERGHYEVQISSISVGGAHAQGAFGRVLIDSGSTFTYFGSHVYNAVKNGIQSYCESHHNCRAKNHNRCWTVSPRVGLRSFPNIIVKFGSFSTSWPPKAYLYKALHYDDVYCYGFQNDGDSAQIVLGATWMLHHDVIFDIEHRQVGIAEADCPEFNHSAFYQESFIDGISEPAESLEWLTAGVWPWAVFVVSLISALALGCACFLLCRKTSKRSQQRQCGLLDNSMEALELVPARGIAASGRQTLVVDEALSYARIIY